MAMAWPALYFLYFCLVAEGLQTPLAVFITICRNDFLGTTKWLLGSDLRVTKIFYSYPNLN